MKTLEQAVAEIVMHPQQMYAKLMMHLNNEIPNEMAKFLEIMGNGTAALAHIVEPNMVELMYSPETLKRLDLFDEKTKVFENYIHSEYKAAQDAFMNDISSKIFNGEYPPEVMDFASLKTMEDMLEFFAEHGIAKPESMDMFRDMPLSDRELADKIATLILEGKVSANVLMDLSREQIVEIVRSHEEG